MSQIRYFFTATRDKAYAASDRLELVFEDEGVPIAVLEVDEAADIHEVSVYAGNETRHDIQAMIRDVLLELGIDTQARTEELPDIDWVSKSLEDLAPVHAGRFIVHGSHDRDKIKPGNIAIEIEAGQAFGTGHHGTTSGCLIMLDRIVQRERPRKALDLGTGSAVLAIALAKRARIPVLATDIDPVATKVARENVRLNEVERLVTCETAVGFRNRALIESKPFDLIIANILARPLMSLAPEMARHLSPGGSVILSGILSRQRESVIAAYRNQGFRHVRTIWREGWVTIHMQR
ncbi:MAG: 50S ribosomal protein L11 methyltransferase [Zhengella sp.]|uniref:50S ribosomal protein L11 methyltransferase n=1 Tax=Zhengella sp. TaxID=2282762 RepID=UPI00352723DF|nr:50S ribosomal protein L11 methyltransferase [Brucellaceae bacterium]